MAQPTYLQGIKCVYCGYPTIDGTTAHHICIARFDQGLPSLACKSGCICCGNLATRIIFSNLGEEFEICAHCLGTKV